MQTQTKPAAKERPIIFSGEMVRAILEGKKTMTRRVIKGLPSTIKCASAIPESGFHWRFTDFNGTTVDRRCPYGRPALPLEPCERLWVRETWCQSKGRTARFPKGEILYRADHGYTGGGQEYDLAIWKPSIFMPRIASRINLEVINVRVERLREITPKDAVAEGIESRIVGDVTLYRDYSGPAFVYSPSPVLSYQSAWDSINAKRGFGWESNPFVWVIEFKPVS